MSCIHVHEKATTVQHVHSLLPWSAAEVCIIELDHDCLLTGFFFFQFLSLRLFLFFFQLSLLRMPWHVHDSV